MPPPRPKKKASRPYPHKAVKPPPAAPPPSAKVVVHEQQRHEVPVKTTGDGTAAATATKNGSSLVDAASGLPSFSFEETLAEETVAEARSIAE